MHCVNKLLILTIIQWGRHFILLCLQVGHGCTERLGNRPESPSSGFWTMSCDGVPVLSQYGLLPGHAGVIDLIYNIWIGVQALCNTSMSFVLTGFKSLISSCVTSVILQRFDFYCTGARDLMKLLDTAPVTWGWEKQGDGDLHRSLWPFSAPVRGIEILFHATV